MKAKAYSSPFFDSIFPKRETVEPRLVKHPRDKNLPTIQIATIMNVLKATDLTVCTLFRERTDGLRGAPILCCALGALVRARKKKFSIQMSTNEAVILVARSWRKYGLTMDEVRGLYKANDDIDAGTYLLRLVEPDVEKRGKLRGENQARILSRVAATLRYFRRMRHAGTPYTSLVR